MVRIKTNRSSSTFAPESQASSTSSQSSSKSKRASASRVSNAQLPGMDETNERAMNESAMGPNASNSNSTNSNPGTSESNVSPGKTKPGLAIAPTFCPKGVIDPFDTVEWELRTAAIKDETGKALFEQREVEIPATWTQLATNVVVSKYFYGENNTSERERSVRQVIHRVTRTITDWGKQDGYFASESDAETFYRELTWLCLHQCGAFNSP